MTVTATISVAGDPQFVHTLHVTCLSEAERRCTLGFNPGGHAPTLVVKAFHAAAMQAVVDQRQAIHDRRNELLERLHGDEIPHIEAGHQDAMRNMATALTHLETAQMYALKGLHALTNAGVPPDA